MSKEIISQLKKIKEYNGQLNADRVWVAQNKEQLLRQIGNTVHEEKRHFNFENLWEGLSIFMPNRLVYSVVRPVAVFLLIGAVATSSWIASVSATQNCLPGEVCYGVKMVGEGVEEKIVKTIGSDESIANMYRERVDTRTAEVVAIAEQNSPDSKKNFDIALKGLGNDAQKGQESLKNVAKSQPEKLLGATTKMVTTFDESTNKLKEVENKNPEVDTTKAKNDVADASLGAITNIVNLAEQPTEGKQVATTEQVRDLLTDRINNTLDNNKLTENKAVGVVNDIVPTSTPSFSITSTLPIILTTSAPVLSDEVKKALAEFIKNVGENGKVLQKILDEVQSLIDSNKFSEALEKLGEANKIKQLNEKAVLDSSKVIKDAVSTNTTSTASIVLPGPVTSTPIVIPTIVPVVSSTLINKK